MAVRFGAEIRSAKNSDGVILCAYRVFSVSLPLSTTCHFEPV
jgi:hypothetical protein